MAEEITIFWIGVNGIYLMQILNFLAFEHSASRRNAIEEEFDKVSKNRVCDHESVLRTQPGIRICYIDRD